MRSTKRNKRMMIAISAGFIGLMLIFSAALYLSSDGPVRVESRNIQTDPGFSLDPVNQEEEVYDPMSHLDENLRMELIEEYELAGEMDFDLAMTNEQVPEPATLGLLTVGSLGLLSRRRRKA